MRIRLLIANWVLTLLVLATAPCAFAQVDVVVKNSTFHANISRVKATPSSSTTDVVVKFQLDGLSSDAVDLVANDKYRVSGNPNTDLTLSITQSDYNVPILVSAVFKKTVPKATAQNRSRTSRIVQAIDETNDSELQPPLLEVDDPEGTGVQLASAELAQADTAPAKTEVVHSLKFVFLVDSVGPELSDAVADSFPGGSATVTVEFKDNDLNPNSVNEQDFLIYQESTNLAAAKSYSQVPVQDIHNSTNRTVELDVRHLSPGSYFLAVKDVADVVGNTSATAPGSFTAGRTAIQVPFEVAGGRQRGRQVEYPAFLSPEDKPQEFIPGDRVDTRVVQLYYFRDARLVVEYINRNVQDLNQVAYDEAQRFAETARQTAANKIDDRRFQETVAVEQARQTRELQHQLDQSKEELAKLNQMMQEIAQREATNSIALTKFGTTTQELPGAIAKTQGDLETQKKTLSSHQDEVAKLPQYQADVAKWQALKDERQKLSDQVDTAQMALNQANGMNTGPLQMQLDTANAALKKFDTDHPNIVMSLAVAKKKLDDANQIDLDQDAATLSDTRNKEIALSALNSNIIRLGKEKEAVTNQQEAVQNAVDGLPRQLLDQQTKEISSRNDVVKAEANELRAAQEQFRREVAAGLADRNSYAAGKKESIDPVTQTTLSVVGTSRIQLRGPIKGINKICRMIHQLDSPVGQVKLGIHTVQVNGEHGDRMDFVYERINQEIAHSRFLTNTSGQMFRKAVHEVAAQVALEADQGQLPEGCPPELIEGVSKTRSRRSSRSKIVQVNGEYVEGLPVEAVPTDGGLIVEGYPGVRQTDSRMRERRYLYAFFGSDFIGELEEMDSELLNSENKMLSINSMDTISLAGALFVTAHADHPIRARIIQRFQELIQGELPERETQYIAALTHVTKHGKSLQNRFKTAMRIDNRNNAEIYFNANRTYHFPNTVTFFNDQVPGQGTMNPVQYATVKLAQTLKAQLVAEMELKNRVLEWSLLETKRGQTAQEFEKAYSESQESAQNASKRAASQGARVSDLLLKSCQSALTRTVQGYEKAKVKTPSLSQDLSEGKRSISNAQRAALSDEVTQAIVEYAVKVANLPEDEFIENVWENGIKKYGLVNDKSRLLDNAVADTFYEAMNPETDLGIGFRELQAGVTVLAKVQETWRKAVKMRDDREQDILAQRLLDQFIDEQEEKSVELMEALRSHSSNVDNYLKRLAIAVEDDVEAQFYQPAFERIRRVSRTWDVTLSQIETTTVLTNNRTLAKVDPAATFEFDLPHRDILLTEALNGSKALATEYGNLLKDGTFLAGSAMLSGQVPQGVVGDNAPVQGIPGMSPQKDFGSDLQKLIPDPAIYKFETGTGFEIRPIIQPDGHSIVYGFDYMYSTNVREPVRADEKHLGRVKRHFVHTDVQTSSYELREISRYTVALKASRTERGVPLFEDIPGIGAAFRPLPSDESSLQTNIILGSSTIYPTVFDLMGLRWSAFVDQLSSPGIAQEKTTQVNRREELRSQLLRTTSDRVNERIRLQLPQMTPTHQVVPTPRFQTR